MSPRPQCPQSPQCPHIPCIPNIPNVSISPMSPTSQISPTSPNVPKCPRRRFQLDRDPGGGRYCASCGGWHAAEEGDLWAESSLLGLRVTYLACMDGHIYDVTEWAGCQRVVISPDSHRVPCHLSCSARTATPAGRQRSVLGWSVLGCPGGTQGCPGGVLGTWGCPGGTQGCPGGVLGCPGVSWGVLGVDTGGQSWGGGGQECPGVPRDVLGVPRQCPGTSRCAQLCPNPFSLPPQAPPQGQRPLPQHPPGFPGPPFPGTPPGTPPRPGGSPQGGHEAQEEEEGATAAAALRKPSPRPPPQKTKNLKKKNPKKTNTTKKKGLELKKNLFFFFYFIWVSLNKIEWWFLYLKFKKRECGNLGVPKSRYGGTTSGMRRKKNGVTDAVVGAAMLEGSARAQGAVPSWVWAGRRFRRRYRSCGGAGAARTDP
uniref:Cleavage inducing molecular chaperone Jiv domain-containing protein n=1 Tax=Taeniopygia guttata TaxID=59729 RepID=A0A674HI06_TAEGU